MKGLCDSLDLGVIVHRCGGEGERKEGRGREEQQAEGNDCRHGGGDECGRWREGHWGVWRVKPGFSATGEWEN